MSTEPIRVWALPPIWGTPSPSPFAIKLMTWLRMAGLPYEAPLMRGPPRSPTRKIPYVELPAGELVHDSGLIIARLSSDHGIDLDRDLTPRARATGHAIRRMCEEHLYFAGLWERWVSNAGFEASARDYFAHLPAVVRLVLPRLLRRRMRQYLHGQGLGRHRPESLVNLATADLDALAAHLDGNDFVLGSLSSVDATAYGFLCALRSHPFESALRDAIEQRSALVDYVERMRDRYWRETA